MGAPCCETLCRPNCSLGSLGSLGSPQTPSYVGHTGFTPAKPVSFCLVLETFSSAVQPNLDGAENWITSCNQLQQTRPVVIQKDGRDHCNGHPPTEVMQSQPTQKPQLDGHGILFKGNFSTWESQRNGKK